VSLLYCPYSSKRGNLANFTWTAGSHTMPYNNAAIPPRREPTGSTQLPLSRVRKMIQIDQDINICSASGAFAITLATELFIQYLAEQGHNVVKSERKPRRNIQYRDLSNAVSRLDNLEFLVDVVPKTIPFKEVKEKKAPTNANINGDGSSMELGQTTLDHGQGQNSSLNGITNGASNGMNGSGSGMTSAGNGMVVAGPAAELLNEEEEAEDPNAQLVEEMQIRGANANATRVSIGSERVVDAREEDVEMH